MTVLEVQGSQSGFAYLSPWTGAPTPMELADPLALQCYTSALLLRPAGTGLAAPTEDVSACGDHVPIEGIGHCLQRLLGVF